MLKIVAINPLTLPFFAATTATTQVCPTGLWFFLPTTPTMGLDTTKWVNTRGCQKLAGFNMRIANPGSPFYWPLVKGWGVSCLKRLLLSKPPRQSHGGAGLSQCRMRGPQNSALSLAIACRAITTINSVRLDFGSSYLLHLLWDWILQSEWMLEGAKNLQGLVWESQTLAPLFIGPLTALCSHKKRGMWQKCTLPWGGRQVDACIRRAPIEYPACESHFVVSPWQCSETELFVILQTID